MQDFQRVLIIAFLVLSILCFCATVWVISVEKGTEKGTGVFSYLMAVVFVLAGYWSVRKLMGK